MNLKRAFDQYRARTVRCGHPPCDKTFDRRESRRAGHPGYCSADHYEYEEVILANI